MLLFGTDVKSLGSAIRFKIYIDRAQAHIRVSRFLRLRYMLRDCASRPYIIVESRSVKAPKSFHTPRSYLALVTRNSTEKLGIEIGGGLHIPQPS